MEQRVGILYHPKLDKARAFTDKLKDFLASRGISIWLCSAWEEDMAKPQVAGSDLILSIGGDGTILRAARAVVPNSVPIVGINLGRLGFMTELNASEALEKLPGLLRGEGWIEDRTMLEAELLVKGDRFAGKNFYALNDVVIGRRASARLVIIETIIDGAPLTTYRADGVIVATATGSTGYSLAAGGPILHPEADEIILKPISPHFSLSQALILPPKTIIDFRVTTSHEAMISLDGQVELPLSSGDGVKVKLSSHVTRFLRTCPQNYFYALLESKLKGKTP